MNLINGFPFVLQISWTLLRALEDICKSNTDIGEKSVEIKGWWAEGKWGRCLHQLHSHTADILFRMLSSLWVNKNRTYLCFIFEQNVIKPLKRVCCTFDVKN